MPSPTSVDTEQLNQFDPNGHTHVVANQIQQPDGAQRREWHGEQNDESFGERFFREVQVEGRRGRSRVVIWRSGLHKSSRLSCKVGLKANLL